MSERRPGRWLVAEELRPPEQRLLQVTLRQLTNHKLRCSGIRRPAANSQCHKTDQHFHAARDAHDVERRIPNSYARNTHTRIDVVPVSIPDRSNRAVRGGDGAAGVDNDELLLLKL